MVHRVLDRVDPESAAAPSDAAAIVSVDRANARLQALRLSLVAAADRAGVADESGMAGTGAWLAAQTRADGASAAADVRLAGALDTGLPATREALAAGELSAQHATVIADATAQLPQELSPEQANAIEAALVTQAKLVDPRALRRMARRALAAAERSQAAVDAHEDRLLRSEEERAWAKARLSLRDHGDGTATGHFTVPTVAAAILRKVIQQMASPRRFADRAAQRGASTAAAQREVLGRVDWPTRYGQAFAELLEHLPTDRLHGKVAATVVVTVDHDRLKAQIGAAHLDTGDDLSASTAGRLACNAGILPAVLGRRSVPLDLGRSDRFFSQAQRLALATVYRRVRPSGAIGRSPGLSSIINSPGHAGARPICVMPSPCAGNIIGESMTRTTNLASGRTTTAPRRSPTQGAPDGVGLGAGLTPSCAGNGRSGER